MDLATNRARKAEIENTITAMLDSCCCQNASQTMSTCPLASLIPEILTMATATIKIERQSERPRANFWRVSTRTSHSRTIGNDRTMMSVVMSTTVVMAVSRMTLKSPEGPEQAEMFVGSAMSKSEMALTYTLPAA